VQLKLKVSTVIVVLKSWCLLPNRIIGYTNFNNSFLEIGFDASDDSFEGLTSDFLGNPFDRVHVADMLHEATPVDDMYMGRLRLDHLFFCTNGARDENTEGLYDAEQPLVNLELGELRGDRSSELLEDLTKFCLSLPPKRQNLISVTIFGFLERISTPHKIRNLVNAYFHYWYPHCPLVHRPSFDIGSVSLPLLFVITIIGSLFSSAEDKSALVEEIIDLAEDYAFLNPTFVSLTMGDCTLLNSAAALESILAAFLISKVQICSGSSRARRRIRLSRYGEIITVCPIFLPIFILIMCLGCPDNLSDECFHNVCSPVFGV
jgi:hypothetical protein